MIPPLVSGQVVFVAGPVASGKSYLLKQWALAEERMLFFDTVGDHVDTPEFEHIWNNPRALAERLAQIKDEPYKIAYHPQDVEDGFSWTVDAYWQLDHPRTLFIEEIHELMSPWQQHPKMRILNKYARKRASLGVIGASQRISDVHKDFTSAARLVVLFHTDESKDVQAIAERWGNDVSEAVSSLRSLVYRDDSGTVEQTPQAVIINRTIMIGSKKWEVIDVG